MQRKHYYDFTLPYLEVVEKGPFASARFKIKNTTSVLTERIDEPSTKNIRSTINTPLIQEYEGVTDFFTRGFTIITDSAVIMARVAGASVS